MPALGSRATSCCPNQPPPAFTPSPRVLDQEIIPAPAPHLSFPDVPLLYQLAQPSLTVTAHIRVRLGSHRGGRLGLKGHVVEGSGQGAPTPSMGNNLVGQPQYSDVDKT
ncbi:hypothetical protein DSO57_1031998 [Entomophthora muscae]|uniref:Uncharacterized protein n=1 Tax=Entomophthora muscae TaxID=34485 RepID=A0ACC2RRG0_9FUNG|nr:hypothetical protein DSO57_1031998 [Entomophthora muscae]